MFYLIEETTDRKAYIKVEDIVKITICKDSAYIVMDYEGTTWYQVTPRVAEQLLSLLKDHSITGPRKRV